MEDWFENTISRLENSILTAQDSKPHFKRCLLSCWYEIFDHMLVMS